MTENERELLFLVAAEISQLLREKGECKEDYAVADEIDNKMLEIAEVQEGK